MKMDIFKLYVFKLFFLASFGCCNIITLYFIIIFDEGTGCIPAGAMCFCYRLDGEYFWATFREPILGRKDIKLHVNVINKHGRITT